MAPEGEQPVIKMKQYSEEFNANRLEWCWSMQTCQEILLIMMTNDDPAQNLKIIDGLERNLNTVENASAVSVVFDEGNWNSANNRWPALLAQLEETPGYSLLPEDVRNTFEILLDQQVTQGATFWDLLTTPENLDSQVRPKVRFSFWMSSIHP